MSAVTDLDTDQTTGQDDQPTTGQDSTSGGENLDALAREAASLDDQTDTAAAMAEQKSALVLVQSNAAELLATLHMARGLALPILPKRKAALLAQVWTDQVLEQAASAGGEVLALHGQSMGNMIGKYAPYVVLIGVLVRPVLETREILATPDPLPVSTTEDQIREDNGRG